MKRKKLLFALIPILLLLGIGIFLFLKKAEPAPEDVCTATGESALLSLKDICGESRVEKLGDIKEARGNEHPEQYLSNSSTYSLDEEAIEVYVETYLTAAESTAQAKNLTLQALIVEEWGYESIDSYREEASQLVLDFIKQRLAVYTAAKELNLSITEKEYDSKLNVYALSFGYSSAEEFTYACTPASIANEMLYDKVISTLQE